MRTISAVVVLAALLVSGYALSSHADLAVHAAGRYIVHHTRNNKEHAVKHAKSLGATIETDLPQIDAFAVQFTETGATTASRKAAMNKMKAMDLESDPSVKLVEVDPPRQMMGIPPPGDTCVPPKPFDNSGALKTKQIVPYGIPLVQADQVTYNVKTPKRVCIIDSGIDIKHPDLCGQPYNCSGRITGSFNFPFPRYTPFEDPFGHGTVIAGTIAALNNTFGVVGVIGNGARLHIVNVITYFGGLNLIGGLGNYTTYGSVLAAAAIECFTAGSSVVSVAFNGPRPSQAEVDAFALLDANNVLTVAPVPSVISTAAGGFGSEFQGFPASYSSVLAVASVDSSLNRASFSSSSPEVALSAPGVSVVSTVSAGCTICAPFANCAVNAGVYSLPCAPLTTSVSTPTQLRVTAPLVDCGLGAPGVICPGAAGKICAIQRTFTYFVTDQLNACKNSGGVGAIIINNGNTTISNTGVRGFPAAGVDQCSQSIVTQFIASGRTVTINNQLLTPHAYTPASGTSYAVPFVAGVAALVWSNVPGATVKQVRQALLATAKDLGDPGYDKATGFGLVQARAALDYLNTSPLLPPGAAKFDELCIGNADCVSGICINSRCSCAVSTFEGQGGMSIGCAAGQTCVPGPYDIKPTCATTPRPVKCVSDADCPTSVCDTACINGTACVSHCRFVSAPLRCHNNRTCASGYCLPGGSGRLDNLAILQLFPGMVYAQDALTAPDDHGICCDPTAVRVDNGLPCPNPYGSARGCACKSGRCQLGVCACAPCKLGKNCPGGCTMPQVCVAGQNIDVGQSYGFLLSASKCGAPAPPGAFCLYNAGCASGTCIPGQYSGTCANMTTTS